MKDLLTLMRLKVNVTEFIHQTFTNCLLEDLLIGLISNVHFLLLLIINASDPFEKRALKAQINEFGQTPKQIFKEPHLKRRTKMMRVKDLHLNQSAKDKLDKEENNVKTIQETHKTKESPEKQTETHLQKKPSNPDSPHSNESIPEPQNTKMKKGSIMSHENRIKELLKRDTMDFMEQSEQIIREIKQSPNETNRRNSDCHYNYVHSKKYKFKSGASKVPSFVQLKSSSNLNFTSNNEELLFIDNSQNVHIVDCATLSAQKTLKVTEANLQTVAKLSEHHFVLGCSHGKISLYNDSYASMKQSFEAHDHSVTSILISTDKVTSLPNS